MQDVDRTPGSGAQEGASAQGAVLDWRKYLKVHPAADEYPLMRETDPAAFKALVEDIRANGTQNQLVFWVDAERNRWLVDGRNRLDAEAEIGALGVERDDDDLLEDDEEPEDHLVFTKEWNGKEWVDLDEYQHRRVVDWSEKVDGDPYALAASYNLHRRNLKPEEYQKHIAVARARIEAALKANPNRSNQVIADETGVGKDTVRRVRESTRAPAPVDGKRLGKDGKTRKAKQTKTEELSKRAEPFGLRIERHNNSFKLIDPNRSGISVVTGEPVSQMWLTWGSAGEVSGYLDGLERDGYHPDDDHAKLFGNEEAEPGDDERDAAEAAKAGVTVEEYRRDRAECIARFQKAVALHEAAEFANEVVEFRRDYTARLRAWLAKKPALDADTIGALARSLHICSDEYTHIAHAVEDYGESPRDPNGGGGPKGEEPAAKPVDENVSSTEKVTAQQVAAETDQKQAEPAVAEESVAQPNEAADDDLDPDEEEDIEPEPKRKRSIKFVDCESHITEAVSDAFDELRELGSEFREIVDNAPDNLRDTELNQTREATADELENLDQPDVPTTLGETVVKFALPKRYQSRAVRAGNASSMLEACCRALEDIPEDDDRHADAQELIENLQSAIDTVGGCEFPGMYR
jgi:hypothetical protein